MLRMILVFVGSVLSGTAAAGTLYTVNASTNELLEFDTQTLNFFTVGALGVEFDFGSLAWDETNQVMYMSPGRSDQGLYTVDLVTGAASLIGIHGIGDLFAIEVDPTTGLIYGGPAGSSSFYMFDPNTAAASYLGDLGLRMSGAEWDAGFGGLVFNQLGTADFYVVMPPSIVPFQLGTGGVFLDDGGLAFDPDTGLYWQFNWSGMVTSFDPNNNFSVVSQIPVGMSLDGAEAADGFSVARLRLARTAGTCPGPETFKVTHATPGASVAFAYGAPGSLTLAAGPCAGTTVFLSRPRLIRTVVANAAGEASISGNVPAAACGARLLAMDMSTCRVTNTVSP